MPNGLDFQGRLCAYTGKVTGRRETGRKEIGERMKGDRKKRNGKEEKWIEGEGSGGDSSKRDGGRKETIVKVMGRCQEGGRWERKLARRREGKVTC